MKESSETIVEESVDQIVWKFIDKYFQDNPQALVNHHVESYNDFFKQGIFRIFREKNPLKLYSDYDADLDDYRSQCSLYFGGKDGTKIYFGKPVIYDESEEPTEGIRYMFPNEARLRNMTYAMTVHYDIDVEFVDHLTKGGTQRGGTQDGARLETAEFFDKLERGEIEIVGGIPDADADADDTVFVAQDDDREVVHDLHPKNPFSGGGTNQVSDADGKPKHCLKMTPSVAAKLREAMEKSVTGGGNGERPVQTRTLTLDKMYLGKFPIMVQSDFCILHGTSRETRFNMGECRNDVGGYFIIDGKEKVVVPQEKFGDNMLYLRKGGGADDYLFSAEIKSVSENVTKPVRTLSIHLLAPTSKWKNGNIVVNIPNVRKPVPLFILFRALGILSDKDILATCLLDLDRYEDMLDLFVPSVHDGAYIHHQRTAIEYIAYLTKGKAFHHGLEILMDYLLPHVGESNYRDKAYYLGYMVFRMMSVATGLELPTDRDHFKYKRVELVGSLLYDLFQEYYKVQLKSIHLQFERKLNLNAGAYGNNLMLLIQENYREIFRDTKTVDDGFRKAFKGNWGAFSHTKRIGVVQDMNRLSFNSALSHLRKTNLPMDASLKLVGPRLLHNSQWGIVDPIDTPDGGNIGIHKNLSIATQVSRGHSREPMIRWLQEIVALRPVGDFVPLELMTLTKVMVNGYWAGCLSHPLAAVEKIRNYRRLAMIPLHTSVTFDCPSNVLYIYVDAGRLCRPIFYVESGKVSYQRKEVLALVAEDDTFTWDALTRGFPKRRANVVEGFYTRIHDVFDHVPESLESDPKKLADFLEQKAVIDYIDSSETEHALIAFHPEDVRGPGPDSKIPYTHCEIHESLLFGVMTNQIPFAETNPLPRDLFSCGQSKQACSLYHTNHQMRMDKTAVVLQSGQTPLVKTNYLHYLHHEENPNGENAIVAIMCYTGYNVEDAILINEGALQRGLFRTTYYTTYEAHEESGGTGTEGADAAIDKKFTQIEAHPEVVGIKPGYDYSQLDAHGLIREGTPVHDKTILMGLSTSSGNPLDPRRGDASKGPKKGQIGVVDKVFMTEGEAGERLAKVRVREERIPAMGDKFAGRAGQKGTIGMVIPERDMPYTQDGLRPDIIINPHAIPSRMTIGQLAESLVGKAAAHVGAFADATSFNQRGLKRNSADPQQGNLLDTYGEMLQRAGFHARGNDVMYNGMTGEQIEADIFVGPTYYMRLKHMVKDKINYRALGPRSALTKQPVGGRANDGGLRIGEMERDSILGHGAVHFLKESMMERGDQYFMAVCNQTGMVAIYNAAKDVFMSPLVDGPLRFTSTESVAELRVNMITKYGRNFSIVEIPYAFKLLIQECMTMGVQMRLITEDTLSQMESLSYASIRDPSEWMATMREAMAAQRADTSAPIATPGHLQEIQEEIARAKVPDAVMGDYTEENPSSSQWREGGVIPQPHDELRGGEALRSALRSAKDSGTESLPNTGGVLGRHKWSARRKMMEVEVPALRSAVMMTTSTFGVGGNGGNGHSSVATPGGTMEVNHWVHWVGDTDPTRIWRIQAITPNERLSTYVTLVTEDPRLPEASRIQVVRDMDVIPAVPMGQPQTYGGGVGEPVGMGMDAMIPPMGGMGHIAFNPIIINGGNYNGGNPEEMSNSQPHAVISSGGGEPAPSRIPSAMMDSIKKQGGGAAEAPKKSMLESIVDFGKNMIVKKIG